MKGKGCIKGSMVFCTVVSFALVQPAYAYIDPGTGSAILQGILAGVVTLGVVLKLYWHKLLKLVGIRKDVVSGVKETQDKG